MIKKIFTLLLLLQTGVLFAQEEENENRADELPPTSWSFMTGSMFYFYNQKLNGQSFTGINTLGVYGFRYNFKNVGKRSVLSASAVPGLGVAFFSGFNQSNVFFSFDLPLMLEFHTGAQASPYTEDLPAGFFAGGGIGLNYLDKSFYLSNPKSGFSYGPAVNAGVKLKFNNSVIILRGSYLYNLNSQVPDLKGIGILWGSR